jgi:hypothetical protein
LCVPLVVRGEVVGAIHLSSNSLTGAYESKDLALLRAIAQPAALAVANARLRRKIEEEAAMRAELSRFLSPALVEKAVRNELNLGTTGDKVQCTVLFSDIRGFTTISDGAAPEQVVSMLNEYFDAMVEVVFQYGGTLDKFLGDGLMAVWGTPVQAADDPVRAVRAALEMRRALQEIVNASRRDGLVGGLRHRHRPRRRRSDGGPSTPRLHGHRRHGEPVVPALRAGAARPAARRRSHRQDHPCCRPGNDGTRTTPDQGFRAAGAGLRGPVGSGDGTAGRRRTHGP